MKTSKLSRLFALLLTVVMVITMLPLSAIAAETEGSATFQKVTSQDALTTGQYVLVADTGYAPDYLDGTWVLAAQPNIANDQITDPTAGVWKLTVDTDGKVVMTDAKGTAIAPKGGNTNGIQSGEYHWSVSFNDGKFTFAGTGADTVMLASNKAQQNKFRA